MGQFTSIKHKNKETGILGMIVISLFILTSILIIYNLMGYLDQEEIIENDSFKFFFKQFIRKTGLLFTVKI